VNAEEAEHAPLEADTKQRPVKAQKTLRVCCSHSDLHLRRVELSETVVVICN
jgi:hypothetical protein